MKQRKRTGSEPENITENLSSIAINGLPVCLNPDPDSRLTSIVKVVRLSSSPFFIEYSSGIQRGKNDKVDAKRIAIYASRFHDKVRYYEHPTEDIERLRNNLNSNAPCM